MTIRSHILSAAMLLILGGSPAYSQTGGDHLAADLNELRQRQRQLEVNIEQYQRSIELLRSNLPRDAGPSPALEALKARLIQSQTSLIELFEKEAALQQQLLSGRATGSDNDAEDVARMKTLLNKYYAAEALIANTSRSSADGTNLAPAGGNYPLDKVRLSGLEGVSAILYMDQRLAEQRLVTSHRQLDIIFHIEVRKDGELVSSGSHSLKSLGRSYYVSKVSLQGGTATVSIRKSKWIARLSPDQDQSYLITLYLPLDASPELHLIPVDELKAIGWRERPHWLPPIGALPPAPESS